MRKKVTIIAALSFVFGINLKKMRRRKVTKIDIAAGKTFTSSVSSRLLEE
jgi:hypothetical protein